MRSEGAFNAFRLQVRRVFLDECSLKMSDQHLLKPLVTLLGGCSLLDVGNLVGDNLAGDTRPGGSVVAEEFGNWGSRIGALGFPETLRSQEERALAIATGNVNDVIGDLLRQVFANNDDDFVDDDFVQMTNGSRDGASGIGIGPSGMGPSGRVGPSGGTDPRGGMGPRGSFPASAPLYRGSDQVRGDEGPPDSRVYGGPTAGGSTAGGSTAGGSTAHPVDQRGRAVSGGGISWFCAALVWNQDKLMDLLVDDSFSDQNAIGCVFQRWWHQQRLDSKYLPLSDVAYSLVLGNDVDQLLALLENHRDMYLPLVPSIIALQIYLDFPIAVSDITRSLLNATEDLCWLVQDEARPNEAPAEANSVDGGQDMPDGCGDGESSVTERAIGERAIGERAVGESSCAIGEDWVHAQHWMRNGKEWGTTDAEWSYGLEKKVAQWISPIAMMLLIFQQDATEETLLDATWWVNNRAVTSPLHYCALRSVVDTVLFHHQDLGAAIRHSWLKQLVARDEYRTFTLLELQCIAGDSITQWVENNDNRPPSGLSPIPETYTEATDLIKSFAQAIEPLHEDNPFVRTIAAQHDMVQKALYVTNYRTVHPLIKQGALLGLLLRGLLPQTLPSQRAEIIVTAYEYLVNVVSKTQTLDTERIWHLLTRVADRTHLHQSTVDDLLRNYPKLLEEETSSAIKINKVRSIRHLILNAVPDHVK
ncbi:hypothetical protein GNI_086560 [Gregarina niphandrodes]|uniref:Uncharacterized protein n=1 Tax=Gregarina niphandrodes TaxID=110365 RepID=A0A023B687_GRENI|nr:hypothetical protein GNI_086560 [Gregarina niphandrodes]EZG63630.1 hypothetical protein GNI_086560 [Gregarina niphandrodes]|eukprot:XP_011130670.1 hypothetical protein GNI_086560 [Gregarina niphandrodes]